MLYTVTANLYACAAHPASQHERHNFYFAICCCTSGEHMANPCQHWLFLTANPLNTHSALPKHASPVILAHTCRFKPTLELSDGNLSMGYLNEGRKGFMGGLSKRFGNRDNAVASPGEAAAKADIYIVVNASTIELPDIEKYAAEYVGDKPIVLWNLELDTLRADLGEQLSACCLHSTAELFASSSHSKVPALGSEHLDSATAAFSQLH